jgi:hypothetical protein
MVGFDTDSVHYLPSDGWELADSLPKEPFIFIKGGKAIKTLDEEEMKMFPTICNTMAHL